MRYDAQALADAVAGPEVDYTVALPGEGADAEVFFSDLSHDYVTINADYTTTLRATIGTLLEALPYIREFHGQTVVIKYGGAAMTDPELREDFARDVVLLKYVGLNPVVVHGGGPEITRYMEALDLPVEFVSGLRVSDADTVEIAKMVLVGKVNKDIVLRINRHGQPAVGLCGDDGLLFRVSTMTAPGGEDIGLVGKIERVQVGVINHIAEDYIPVIASVGADREGRSHNVNADEAAGAVARALGAYKVLFLTDVAGWLSDPADPGSLVCETSADVVEDGLDGIVRRHAPQAPGLPGRHPRRRLHRPHHRRPRPALPAARALHGRRAGDEDMAGALALVDNYARYPVEFATRHRVHADGLGGHRVPRPAERHRRLQHRPLPPARRRGHPRAGGAADARLQPLLHARERPARGAAERGEPRRQGVLLQQRRGGQRGGDQARPQAPARRRLPRRPRRLPRPHLRRAVRHPAGGQAGAVRAAGPRLRRPRRHGDRRGGDGRARPRSCSRSSRASRASTSSIPRSCAQIRAACDAHGALLILDEVQTGMGRTGTLWAYEQTGVVPDVITVAKGLGGGFPIGALITTPETADVFAPGDHGSTFAGNPLASAAANAALDVLDDPELLQHVRDVGEFLRERLPSCPTSAPSAASA